MGIGATCADFTAKHFPVVYGKAAIWFRRTDGGQITKPLTLRDRGHEFIDSFGLNASILQSATRYAALHLVGGIIRKGNRRFGRWVVFQFDCG